MPLGGVHGEGNNNNNRRAYGGPPWSIMCDRTEHDAGFTLIARHVR